MVDGWCWWWWRWWIHGDRPEGKTTVAEREREISHSDAPRGCRLQTKHWLYNTVMEYIKCALLFSLGAHTPRHRHRHRFTIFDDSRASRGWRRLIYTMKTAVFRMILFCFPTSASSSSSSYFLPPFPRLAARISYSAVFIGSFRGMWNAN